jgi:hypothetical protein
LFFIEKFKKQTTLNNFFANIFLAENQVKDPDKLSVFFALFDKCCLKNKKLRLFSVFLSAKYGAENHQTEIQANQTKN